MYIYIYCLILLGANLNVLKYVLKRIVQAFSFSTNTGVHLLITITKTKTTIVLLLLLIKIIMIIIQTDVLCFQDSRSGSN